MYAEGVAVPEIAKKVVLDKVHKKLFVDGEEFPWHITVGGPDIEQSGIETLGEVTLTFYADSIEIIA
jgi:hypothetical protein